ncbi:uroporphyrinogen-III synthase [Massilia sp. H6]|uniref:uroporphyrinogen-III synthase n=1 Tax=Massilia sp. H6 TaxID=2970464 RepID=UPI002169267E|nr:uroporphyrinogen-III synthase [Massilia sp. H6]UVW30186.1 uroporphyrinogen-III synthase [Massilia sp. H6]
MPERLVVITRPRAQAAALAQAVTGIGRTPVVLPLLEIAPLPDQSALRAALAHLADYALVAFVSPNAIDAAFAHLAGWPAAVPIGVVGEGSRAALARHGVAADRVTIYCPPDPAQADSEHLLASLDLTRFSGRRVLIVRGESGRELMADTLRAAGAEVATVAAYRRSLPLLDAALARQLSALLAAPNDWIITSSEALRGLAALVRELDPGTGLTRLQQQHLVVPHARIAETARALGCQQVTLTGSGDARIVSALLPGYNH